MEKVKLDSYEQEIEKALENGDKSLSSEEMEEFMRKAEEGAIISLLVRKYVRGELKVEL